MKHRLLAALFVAQIAHPGMVAAVDRSDDKAQNDYTVNVLSDGSKEIIVVAVLPVAEARGVQVLDLRAMLEVAAARECPDGYTLESDGSVEPRPSARDGGLTMTGRGIVVCGSERRRDRSKPVTAERTEIWTYAFIARADDPIAGHGAAFFKSDGDALLGPVWSQEHLPYEMRFSVTGERADAMLWPKKKKNRAVQLAGPVTKESDGKACITKAILEGENHFVVLERTSASVCN